MDTPPYHAAVFGASSTIAIETLRTLVAERPARLLLVGRNRKRLDTVAADLAARGAECAVWATDLADPAIEWRKGLQDRSEGKNWDLFLLAHGSLPDQETALAEGKAVAECIDVNFTSHAGIAAAGAASLQKHARGTRAAFGAGAGDRGRQSNFLYGAAKAGLATFYEGLRHRFARQGDIRIVLLKPGMTDTPMTASMPKGPLFSSAPKVGALAWKAIQKGKPVAHLPGWWRCIMLVIRCMPPFIFHKTKL
jgi:short-subunit dehydrogenase